jgi:hypothetical protein
VIGRADSTGIAILTDSPRSNTNITNDGRILGDIILNDGVGGVLDNRLGGIVSAPTTIDLGGGVFRNAGALHVGGIGRVGETVLTGNLAQSSTGRLVVQTHHAGGLTDLLTVQGSARLGGTVEVRPVLLANRPVTVLAARDGLALEDGLATNRTPVFSFATRLSSNTLVVQPLADFGAAGGLGANQRAWPPICSASGTAAPTSAAASRRSPASTTTPATGARCTPCRGRRSVPFPPSATARATTLSPTC